MFFEHDCNCDDRLACHDEHCTALPPRNQAASKRAQKKLQQGTPCIMIHEVSLPEEIAMSVKKK